MEYYSYNIVTNEHPLLLWISFSFSLYFLFGISTRLKTHTPEVVYAILGPLGNSRVVDFSSFCFSFSFMMMPFMNFYTFVFLYYYMGSKQLIASVALL